MPLRGRARGRRSSIDPSRAHRPGEIQKTADEIECIRRAQAINEVAIDDVKHDRRAGRARHRPHRRVPAAIFELGRVVEHRRPDLAGDAAVRSPTGRSRLTGDVVFPLVTTTARSSAATSSSSTTASTTRATMSDYGHTWIVGDETDAVKKSSARRYRAVIDAVRRRDEAGRHRARPHARREGGGGRPAHAVAPPLLPRARHRHRERGAAVRRHRPRRRRSTRPSCSRPASCSCSSR